MDYLLSQFWSVSVMEQMIGMTDTAFLGRVGEIGTGCISHCRYLLHGHLYDGIRFQHRGTDHDGTAQRRTAIQWNRPYLLSGDLFLIGAGGNRICHVAAFLTTSIEELHLFAQHLEAALSYINWLHLRFLLLIYHGDVPGHSSWAPLKPKRWHWIPLSWYCRMWYSTTSWFSENSASPNWELPEQPSVRHWQNWSLYYFFIIYTWRRVDCRKYALNKLPAFQPEILKRILGVSLWTMIQNLLSMSTWLTFFLFVEHLGERALAVTNIIRNVSGIPFMMTMAFAATCGSLVSNLIGAGETQCVQGTIRQHIRIAYAFVIPLLIFFALFPNLILSIYTDIPSLREASVPSLWVLCTGYLIMVPANVYSMSVSGTGNTRTALIMEMSVLVVYVAYITYLILYLRVDVALCWTSEHVYAILTLILCRWYIQKGNWQQKKI